TYTDGTKNAEHRSPTFATGLMSKTRLLDELESFRAWTRSKVRLLQQLQPWLRQQGLHAPEIKHAIERALHSLRDDRLTVVVAGELSRGKTELLNALFFASLGCRLLPTDAGRTTMCPTEIYCDLDAPPQLRLLPIATRADDCALADLRDHPERWQTFDLDLEDPEMLTQRLQMLTEMQMVSRKEAEALGLLPALEDGTPELISIPRWRLALINIRHPVLAKGLRIVDTPGLNAIGSEPELTYEILPSAQAVLFVLAADTGLTQSDLQIWHRFIQRPDQQRRRGVMVVLNKIDTLWDELRSPQQVTESISKQCESVSQSLQVAAERVFALSAQKALVGRIKQDRSLEDRSGIDHLEHCLARVITVNRIELVQQEYSSRVCEAIDMLESIIQTRLQRNEQQRVTLRNLADQSHDAIEQKLMAAQAHHKDYQRSLDAYKHSLTSFGQHARTMLDALDPRSLDKALDAIRKSMTGAWTTYGLKDAMGKLFEQISDRIDLAGKQTRAMRRLLRATHQRFQSEHHHKLPVPSMFSIVRYQVELSLLDQEAQAFRKSARTALMEQHFVTKRYFATIVTRARRILGMAHDDAQHWSRTVLSPLSSEIKENRDALAQQIADVRQAAGSRRTIEQRIAALKRENSRLQAQLTSMHKFRDLLSGDTGGPTAVASALA
ncbi:MAG: dynamin family protein, partial [Sedimenticolaceae bacterium]